MASLAVLSVLVSGFGYACVACAVGAALAYVWGDELSSMLAMAIDYDGLDIEEIATIEEARAELARKARERRSPQPSTAYIGNVPECIEYESAALMARYTAAWEGDWREVAAERVARLTFGELRTRAGIGPKRARRILDAGDTLTWGALLRACGARAADTLAHSV